MKNAVKVIPRPVGKGVSAFTLNIGEYGRVVNTSGSYAGHILLKAHGVVIDITDPQYTWDSSFTAPYVDKLNTGDKLEISIGFTPEFDERIAKMAKENKINAIKEVRTITNWGLKESKDYVDSLLLPF